MHNQSKTVLSLLTITNVTDILYYVHTTKIVHQYQNNSAADMKMVNMIYTALNSFQPSIKITSIALS